MLLLVMGWCCGVCSLMAQATDSIPSAIPDTIARAPQPNEDADTVVWRNDDDWDLRYEEDARYLMEDVDTTRLAKLADSLVVSLPKLKPQTFTPDPIRSMWLAMVFPGGGQIYNHKYWKLPIFYGGFLGCVYAFSWNSQMLKDYTQAYLDIMDDDPGTKSYEKMLPLNYSIEGKEERFQKIFKNKKDYFRKYRDMSIFAFAGVYLLSIIDAYVDAELSTFDISRDLSLQWQPAVLNADNKLQRRYGQHAIGLQCSLYY